MTNTKSTKRALLVSVMAMVICFTMLLGTTFAWFTDNDEVTDNVIAAGTLDVELTAEKVTLNNVEPGYVHIQNVTIENKGSLAFNYKLVLDRTVDPTTTDDLANVIEVYCFDGHVTPARTDLTPSNTYYRGTLASLIDGTDDFFNASTLLKDADKNLTLVYVVPTSVNNQYQGDAAGTFTVRVLAAQLASETDSINGEYDKDAEYDA